MLGAWLRLLRAPNFLTVPGDPLAGAAVAMADCGTVVPWPGFAVLSVMGLYAAGLLDNDITGLEEDRVRRPDRPLVTGTISLRAARRARFVAWCVGLAAACGAGAVGVLLAVVLSLLIAGYHRVTRTHVVWGPATLAACRGTALCMGAVTTQLSWECWGWRTALALGVWIAWVFALSALARREEIRPSLRRRVGFLLGALPIFQAVAVWASPHPDAPVVGGVLALFAGAHAIFRRAIPVT